MRGIKKYLSELSLTQQLITIVVLTFVFFTLFFFGSISFNIDRFVDRQMFDLVHSSQQNVIYSYQLGLDAPDLFGAYEPNIIHIIKTESDDFISNNDTGISKELMDQIKYELQEPMIENSHDFYGHDRTIYTITKIPNQDAAIATLITRTYKTEFKKLLIQNVINIILILIGVVFLLLLMWVSMIIHPLNQVMDYINKIRKNEKAELKINRKDEIGALANVLVEMNEELVRQEKLNSYVICHFSLAAFSNFSLSLIFVSLSTVCLGVFLLGFILPGTLCTSW